MLKSASDPDCEYAEQGYEHVALFVEKRESDFKVNLRAMYLSTSGRVLCNNVWQECSQEPRLPIGIVF